MKTVPERITALRAAMLAAGASAYILPSSDPHASEYAPAHFTAWEYFSGFSCENANLVVTKDAAALWVDGRFFGAAAPGSGASGTDAAGESSATESPVGAAIPAVSVDGAASPACASSL